MEIPLICDHIKSSQVVRHFKVSEPGDVIFIRFHYHSVVRKQRMFLTTHHKNDGKLNELSKHIRFERNKPAEIPLICDYIKSSQVV